MSNFNNNWNWNFQPIASTTMEKIVDLHNDIMVFLIFIMIFISWMLGRTIWLFRSSNASTLRFRFQHHTRLEQVWTVIPAIILLLIATPSFSLLYALDETQALTPRITLHAIGNQWYWSYDYPNLYKKTGLYEVKSIRIGTLYPEHTFLPQHFALIKKLHESARNTEEYLKTLKELFELPDVRCYRLGKKNYEIIYDWVPYVTQALPDLSDNVRFDSYMISEENLTFGGLRLLEVDNIVTLPIHTPIRILVTSRDVLHSWAIPSLGVKMDACPGRINQVSLFITRKGMFYGQCSELCGVQHSFMPIVIKGVSSTEFSQSFVIKYK